MKRSRINPVRSSLRRGELGVKEKKEVRQRIYERAAGKCEECGASVVWGSGLSNSMHLSHTRSKGAGGSWQDDNLKCLCPNCHMVGVHNPKAVPRK